MPGDNDSSRVYTPLYEARHGQRFERRDLIQAYERIHGCDLIVVSDAIFPYGLALWEELLSGFDGTRTLHVILNSPGGDGEMAIRLVRSAQARCTSLVVVIPDAAKSAATLFALGAHEILMGPTSDLGPIDPQFLLEGRSGLVSAKSIIEAVDHASLQVQEAPETYPVWASLLADVTAIQYQQARAAIGRTADQMKEALASNPTRSVDEVAELCARLAGPLISDPQSHSAVFAAADAARAGLPVTQLDPVGDHWRELWRLWSRYITLGERAIYESARASQVLQR